jgi:hypothetical protein
MAHVHLRVAAVWLHEDLVRNPVIMAVDDELGEA